MADRPLTSAPREMRPEMRRIPGQWSGALWRKYAEYLQTKWEREFLWTMVEPYRRPKSFQPLLSIYIAAFYTGIVGAAITEQLYKEKYWEDHPGENVPLMKPTFYRGPWKVANGQVPAHLQKSHQSE